MKKRILTLLLVLALSASLFAAFAINASATTMGKTVNEMVPELTAFLGIAKAQVSRDDFENMPAGMQTKHPATVKLEGLIEEATALRKAKNEPGAEEKMDAFLVELFGGWDAEKEDYKNGNKPYGDFQNALYLRGEPIEKEVFNGEKGWYGLDRGNYTLESWRDLAAAVAAIDRTFRVVDGYFPLQDMKRSEMYYLIQDYYKAFDNLKKFDGDPKVNSLKMVLYYVLNTNETVDIINFCDYTPFGWELKELVKTSQENPNAPETLAFKAWVDSAWDCYNNPNATVEDIEKYVDNHWYRYGTKEENYEFQVCESPEELDDEAFEEKYPKNERFQNYVKYRDDEIAKFRDSIFVGGNYRDAANKVYFSVYYDYQLGYYSKEDFSVFQKVLDDGIDLGKNYLTTDVQLRAHYDKVLAAHKVLLSQRLDINAYDSVYNKVMEYYNKSIKGWEHLFKADTVNALVLAIDNYEKAKKAYDDAVSSGTTDAKVIDRLYQDLISASYYLEQKFVAIEPLPKPDEGEGEGGNGGGTNLPAITLEALYASASQMCNDASEFEFLMYTEKENSGKFPYSEESMEAFYTAYEALSELVSTYVEETETEKPHSMTKDDFINKMLDLTVAQLSLELANIPNTCND